MAKRLGILLSGTGRTLDNFVRVIREGELDAEIACVVASRAGIRGIDKARGYGLSVRVIARQQFGDVGAFADATFAYLREHRVDLACMSGYLSLLPIAPDFKDRVLNIHPALIPAFCGHGFFGDKVHAAVLAAGVKVTGVTVHFADDTYDNGPILLQRCVPVQPDDDVHTLAQRVFEEECRAYPEAVRLVLAGRVRIEGRTTWIAPRP